MRYRREFVGALNIARFCCFLLVAFMLVPFRLAAYRSRWQLPSRLTVKFHRLLLRGLRLTVVHSDAKFRQGQLIVCNHISWSDIIVLGSISPVTFVAKSDVSAWPIIGMLAKIAPTIFICRTERTRTARQVEAIRVALHKGPVILFPEGTSSSGAHVLPFKSALFEAAEGQYLLPVTLVYGPSRRPEWSRQEREAFAWDGDKTFWPHFISVMRGERVTCRIVAQPSFSFTGNRKIAADQCHALISAGLGGEGYMLDV